MKLRSITKRMLVLGLLTVLGTTGTTSVATAEPLPSQAEVNATGLPRGGWDPVGPNSIGGLLAVSPAGLLMMQPGPPALWLSGDRGGSWTARRGLPVDTAIQGFFADPVNPDRMLAVGNKPGNQVGEWRGLLLRTTDRGETWETLREWYPDGAFGMATDPTGRVVVVQNLDSLSVSTDGGDHWNDVPRTWPREGIAAPVGALKLTLVGDDAYFTTVYPEYSLWVVRGVSGKEPRAELVYRANGEIWQVASDGKRFVVTVGPELHGSTDGGKTWTVLRREPGGQPLREPRFVGGRLYVATYNDIDVTADFGRTWTRKPVPAPGEGVSDMIELPAAAGKPATTLISSVYRGVYADGGKHGYQQIGVPGESIRDLVTTGNLLRENVVAAGVQEIYSTPLPRGKVSPSDRAWQSPRTDRLHEYASLSVSPARPDVVWQVTRNGFALDVLRSGDGGRTWQLTGKSKEGTPSTILAHPAASDRLLVSAFAPSGYVLYRSFDAGKTWEKLSTDNGFTAFAGDPWNANRVWGGDSRGLSRSDDGGKTWTHVSDEPVSSISVSHWGRILVGGAGLLLSEDNGRTFRRVRDGEDPREISRILSHPFDFRVWFASSATGGGVLRSTDFGRTWSPVPGALPDARVLSMAISADGRYLFAGTEQSGAYRLTLY